MRSHRPASIAALLIGATLSSQPLQAQTTSTHVEKFSHSPAATFDSFGRDLLVQGDRALFTANAVDNRGAAFCYRRVGDVWTLSQKFRATDTEVGDSFGFRVQMSGEDAVVSAHLADALGQVDRGAAYVFHDDGTTWTQVQKLLAPDGAASDFFGWSVSIGGDVIVVGAIDDDDGGNLTGSCYVYRRSGPSWVFEQKLNSSSMDPEDEFGFVVETDGQTILVSSVVDGDAGIPSGSVTVFEHNGSAWVEVQRLIPPDAAADDWFGWDVDLDGDRLAVGAPRSDLAQPDGGAVYTYHHDGASWVLEDEFAPSKLSASDVFGWSVALQGDRLVAGAPSTNVPGGELFDGALYEFRFDGSGWVDVAQWVAGDASVDQWPGPNLGFSCALDGATVFAGAPYHDGTVSNAGAVYRFAISEPWADLGGATVGSAGPPALSGAGLLTGGSSASVTLTDAPSGALALAWISFAPVPFAALGGTVHAFPFATQILVFADGSGTFTGATTWPVGIAPGTQVWFQFIVQDVSTIHGLTLSNGLEATTP